MPLQAVEPRRLYRQIAEQLRSLIQQGEYGVGTRLPAERDLASQLAVSRPSVREALIALEVEGLVEVRPGSGIHVVAREPKANAAALAPNAFGPFEIMQARQWLEGELAAHAARHATPEQIKGLREAIVTMEADALAGRTPIRADRLFHLRLAQMAGNAPLLRVVTELFDERNNPLFEQMGQHFENEKSWRQAIAEHRAVVAAVAAHREDAARQAMQRHLERSQLRYAQAWPQTPAQRPARLSRTAAKAA